eukprot:129628-Rhodomonas_salina.1
MLSVTWYKHTLRSLVQPYPLSPHRAHRVGRDATQTKMPRLIWKGRRYMERAEANMIGQMHRPI